MATTTGGQHEDAIWSVAWTPSGQLLSGSVDETAKLWSSTLELQQTFAGHRMGVVSVAANPIEPVAVTSSMDSTLRFWDLKSGGMINEIKAGAVEVWSVAYSLDGKLVASGSQKGHINIYHVQDLSTPVKTTLETGDKFLLTVAFSPDGSKVASGGIDGIINIFDLATGKLLSKLEGHSKAVRSLAFTADGLNLLTASDDMRINVYEVPRNALVSTYTGHSSWVLGVAASPDARHFVSCGADKRIKVWDLASKDCLHTVDRQSGFVWSVAFNPKDPNEVAAGCEDGALFVHNIAQYI